MAIRLQKQKNIKAPNVANFVEENKTNIIKVGIGVGAIAVGAIATVATGGAAAPVILAGLKTATLAGASSAATSTAFSVGKSLITGEKIDPKSLGQTAIDSFSTGFMFGGIASGVTSVINSSSTLTNIVDKVKMTVSNRVSKMKNTLSDKVPDKGFESFKKLKDYLGNPGDGKEWHHIVEQSQIKKSGFAPQQIHNVNNIVSIEGGAGSVHAKISGLYNSKIPGLTGNLSARDWLAGKTFEEQFEFGKKVLLEFGNLIVTNNGWKFIPFE